MEGRVSEVEDRNPEMIHMEEERKPRFFLKCRTLQELSDSIRKGYIRIMGIPEGEERERGTERVFQGIIDESFQNLRKALDIQV